MEVLPTMSPQFERDWGFNIPAMVHRNWGMFRLSPHFRSCKARRNDTDVLQARSCRTRLPY